MANEQSFKEVRDVEYSGYWIRVTVRNPNGNQGLFIGESAIAWQGPTSTDRLWASFNFQPVNVFVDPESAFDDALKETMAYVDRLNGATERID